MTSALKLERTLAVFDLETTGVDVNNDRIVSLAVGWHNGAAWQCKEMRFNPGRPIPAEATAVHGISDADVADKPAFVDVASRVIECFKGCDVAGFNCRSFDVPMLSAEFKRCGIEWPTPDVKIVDVFKIYNRKEPRTLGAAVRLYCGREHENAHNATADVVACLDILEEQAKRYGCSTLDELAALERDPDWLDQDGKVKWVGDVAVINFGKYAGVPLQQIDAGFFDWMLRQDFPADTKSIIADARRGRFPRRTP